MLCQWCFCQVFEVPCTVGMTRQVFHLHMVVLLSGPGSLGIARCTERSQSGLHSVQPTLPLLPYLSLEKLFS